MFTKVVKVVKMATVRIWEKLTKNIFKTQMDPRTGEDLTLFT